MPQRNHVVFDSLGNKGLYFGPEARWAFLAGSDGVFQLQPVAPHDKPTNVLVPASEVEVIGEPVTVKFEKPETIDSLIMQLKIQRHRLQMEIDAKAKAEAKVEEQAKADMEANAQTALGDPLPKLELYRETIKHYTSKMGEKEALVFLGMPQDFLSRLDTAIKAAKPKMSIEEMAACATLGISPDMYKDLMKSVKQAG